MPFNPYFDYDKSKLHTIQPFFPNRDKIQVYDQILQNILLQTPNDTDT